MTLLKLIETRVILLISSAALFKTELIVFLTFTPSQNISRQRRKRDQV